MARRSQVLSHVVWAVDVFEEVPLRQSHSLDAVRALARRTGALVEPVYVLTSSQLNLSGDIGPPWLSNYRPAAEAALDEALKGVDIPNLGTPHVIVQNSGSIRQAVESLAHYVEKSGADLIVVGNHGRKGLKRWILGSFSETLILHTRIPVLVAGSDSEVTQVGPIAAPTGTFEHILFPTDLGPHSRGLFEYVVRATAQLGARLTLFHALPSPVEPFIQSGVYLLGGGWVPVHSYFAQDWDARKKKIEAWVNWANRRGVPTTPVLNEMGGSVSHAVTEFARTEGVDLIALAAQSGPVASALLGSVARQVVRSSPAPVWVLHPPLNAAAGTRGRAA